MILYFSNGGKAMKYKHRFLIVDTFHNNETEELATCYDEMTSNFLADHFRRVYENNSSGFEIIYKFKSQKKIIVPAT